MLMRCTLASWELTTKKVPFVLGHALYLKAIHAGKIKSDSTANNRTGVAEAFEDTAMRYSVETDIQLLGQYDQHIKALEVFLERSAKVHDANNFFLLQSIPGVDSHVDVMSRSSCQRFSLYQDLLEMIKQR